MGSGGGRPKATTLRFALGPFCSLSFCCLLKAASDRDTWNRGALGSDQPCGWGCVVWMDLSP